MKQLALIEALATNRQVIRALLFSAPEGLRRWKPSDTSWCLLEILCHLYDEEREDFRARIHRIFEKPDSVFPPIAPKAWVSDRQYIQQIYDKRLEAFLEERNNSIHWLFSLQEAPWEREVDLPGIGLMSAQKFLVNWVAHDYHHIRQINALKYNYLKQYGGEDLGYAGNWD